MANALAGPNSRPYLPTMPVSVFLSSELAKARNRVIQLVESPQAALDTVTQIVQARLDDVLRAFEQEALMRHKRTVFNRPQFV